MKKNKIYAYTTSEAELVEWKGSRKGKGLIKVGQTRQNVEDRIRQQLQGSPIQRDNFRVLFLEEAINHNNEEFRDTDVFKWLKILGVHRISGTEWFECTVDEVEEAYNRVKDMHEIPIPVKPCFKFTKEKGNTGMSSNKAESDKERALMKNHEHILDLLKKYPEASSAVKLAPKFKEYFNIKHYSQSSISVMIGYTIRDLVDAGLLKRNSRNELSVVNNKNTSCKIIKPKITVKEIKSLLRNRADGITVRELKLIYDITNCESYVYEALNRYFKKVKIFDKTLNRSVHKYLDPKHYDVYVKKNVEYTEEDVNKVSNFLKNKGYGRSDILKETGLPLTVAKKIIKEQFQGLCVQYQSKSDRYYVVKNYYDPAGVKHKVVEMELEAIKKLLKGKDRGMQIKEMSDALNMKESYLYLLVNKLISLKEVYTFSNHYILSEYPLNEWFKKLPMKNALVAFKYNITGDVILDIIKNNPNCSSSEISNILNNELSISSTRKDFSSLIAGYKRVLVNDGLIVLTSRRGQMHVKDENHTYSYSLSKKLERADLIAFVGSNEFGASFKEIYSALGGSISMEALRQILREIPELEKVKVIGVQGAKSFYVYKWFIKGKVKLAPSEDLYDAIMA